LEIIARKISGDNVYKMPNSRNRKIGRRRNSMNKKGKVMGMKWKGCGGGELISNYNASNENNTSTETKKKRLLCISDLEGCANSSIMCEKPTFDAIRNFLKDNNNPEYENHVVFLGDYFDQGPHMMKSINEIGDLIDKYIRNPKYINNPRVHIILGNRDINKFRILYEAVTNVYIDKNRLNEIWSAWNTGPGNFGTTKKDDKGNVIENYIDLRTLHDKKAAKTQELNGRTYGAPNLLKNIQIEYKEKTKTETETTPIDALFILGNIFVNKKILTDFFEKDGVSPEILTDNNSIISSFGINTRKLFYYGKLISNFEMDNEHQIIMSHGGSYNKYIFNLDSKYYDDIKKELTDYGTDETAAAKVTEEYFYDMEKMRKKFANEKFTETKVLPSIKRYIDGINSIYTENFIKNIFTAEGGIAKKDDGSFVNYINEINTNFQFRSNYFVVQSLGLASGDGESGFVSPIASCGVVARCGGTFEKTDDILINQFSTLNIKCVVNGHIPHCVPVPIIYQRTAKSDSGENRVVFVNCDTSNGNTPSNYTSLEMIPLAYVTKDKVGIASLTQLNNTNTENPLGLDRVYKPDKDTPEQYYYTEDEDDHNYYKDLINTWDYDKTPIINENSNLVIDDKIILTKDSKNRMFAPLEKMTLTKGGRKRCSKKMIRKCKRMTKRRRSKMGCGHCC